MTDQNVTPQPPVPEATYLGDGVYATFDGYQIVLDLRGQENPPTTRIALEPAVLAKLNAFAKRVAEAGGMIGT